jgi:DNA-binding MarR family transcriptional regulator
MTHTPRELEKELKAKASQISRTLRELEEMKLVVCHNPDHRKNKLFGLTKLGEIIFNQVRKKFRAKS